MRTFPLNPLGLVLSLGLFACNGDKTEEQKDTSATGIDTYDLPVDADGDGVTEADGDCDDSDAAIYPGRAEDCNGIDDNCNGLSDEGFSDTDADGTADCLDEEECDGVDNDGDGVIDEGYADDDGDGIADCVGVEDCDGIDNDADGEIDEGYDADGDGYTQCGDDDTAADCDDNDASVYPGASEVAGDLTDNDCNGLVDEGEWEAGDLFVTEIMNNPADEFADPEAEWFEVYNSTERTLILNGLVLYSSLDSDWHQVEDSDLLILDPGDYFVFGSNGDSSFNGGVEVGYEYAELSLGNESDDLIIEADGVIIDQVAWDDGDTFPDSSGASMSLDPGYFSADENDSGEWWCASSLPWASSNSYGSPGEDNEYCWPTAVASYDTTSSLYTCDSLTLDGSGSYDPDGAGLSYEWELVSAPASSTMSTSDITKTTSMSPTFIPDVAGTYTFNLTVYNGTEYSPPSSVSVTFTTRPYNDDPIADAGAALSYSENSVCSPISYGVYYSCADCNDYDFDLDGGASYDPDGDWLDDPTWTVMTGTSYATITDEDTWTPTVTVSGVGTTYGVSTDQVVTVQLSVTDCMGASATDTVNLTYTCTGT